jgi:superfamily II DNA or RNA helicase
MNKEQAKSEIQAEILPTVREENRAIVVAATGVGKSKVAVDYAKEICKKKKNAKILIIVPTEKLRDENWLEEFVKWNAKTIWNQNVTRSCYVSANKLSDKEYDLVILDEIHNITENNAEFFVHNTAYKCVGLTATLPKDELKVQILKELGFKVVYELPLDKAVGLGLVSPYEITVIEVRLDDKEKYIKSGTKDKPFFQTELKKYNYLSLMVKRLMFSSNPTAKRNLKWKILDRMRFIYNLKSKTKVAEFLLEEIIPQEERTLIFCGGIDQAEHLNQYSFHSKKKNHEDFDNFKAEKINRLSCVNALNEGHNIPNVDNGLIVQLNSKELNLVQRVGRIVRYRKGHIAQIYIVCAIETQDEKWVAKALEGFDKSSIKYTRFENLVNKAVLV